MIEARQDSSLGTFSVYFDVDTLLIGGLSETQAFTLVANLEEVIEEMIFLEIEDDDEHMADQ